MDLDAQVRRLLEGGPRVRANAARELRAATRKGDAVELPDPADVPEAVREVVRELVLRQQVHAGQWDAVCDAWRQEEHRSMALAVYASTPGYDPRLLEHARTALDDEDAERVAAAYDALASWLGRGGEPSQTMLELLDAGRADTRKTRRKHDSNLAAVCRSHILQSTFRPDARPVIDAFYRPRLEAKKITDRRFAANVVTLGVWRAKDFDALEELLHHEDSTVAKAVRGSVRVDSHVGARELLLEVRDRSLVLKQAVAEGIRQGMEPKAKESEAVAEAREGLFAPDASRRRACIAALTSAISDMTDIRTAAPHLGLSLFDEDASVREEAALAVYYLCDLQRTLWIVRALRGAIELALRDADGDAAENLKSALGSLPKPKSRART